MIDSMWSVSLLLTDRHEGSLQAIRTHCLPVSVTSSRITSPAAFTSIKTASEQCAVAATGGRATILDAESGDTIRTILAWGKQMKKPPAVNQPIGVSPR